MTPSGYGDGREGGPRHGHLCLSCRCRRVLAGAGAGRAGADLGHEGGAKGLSSRLAFESAAGESQSEGDPPSDSEDE